MVIFPLAPDQTIAQMWSNGARGGKWVSAFRLSNNNNNNSECSSTSSQKAGLWLKLIGLVQRSAANCRCDAFITLRPCNDGGSCYGTLKIVGVITMIISMHCFSVTIKIYYKQVSGQRSTWKTTKYTAGCERDLIRFKWHSFQRQLFELSSTVM